MSTTSDPISERPTPQRVQRGGETILCFDASDHFRIPTEVRRSGLAGLGTFAAADALQGTFLGMDFHRMSEVLPPEDYAKWPRYAWRHVEHIYFRGRTDGERCPTDHCNHSADPNVHWHVGVYFAARDIRAGDELFLDYRYLCDPSWPLFDDRETGEPIRGFPWRESLMRSCRELLRLLETDGAGLARTPPERR